MMKLFNLHTHTKFSDGSDAPEKYAEEAIRQGFHTLGFSDHSPVPFKNNFAIENTKVALEDYILTITALKTASPVPHIPGMKGAGSELQILLALEIDYIPGITAPISAYRKNPLFDYFIGSVHLVKNDLTNELWFIDGPDIEIYDNGLKNIFGNDIKKAVTAYYHQINEMVINEKPDIIGHLDKIKMYNRNRYFLEDDAWYVALIDETLDLIRNSGSIVEVNTRGLYKKRSESLFPGPAILKKIKALGIPITLSSDAHKPHEISLYFQEASQLLTNIGFIHLHLKTRDGWEEVRIK
ncbi:MAG: histidinol-phosphatase [Bacteroidetes bacterium]|nr:histidinol-phosphatase [Bacteroidota bacterium]